MILGILTVLAFQPSPAMLRQLFEEAFEQRKAAYGEADARTAQAARDLGMFLAGQGQVAAARRALGEAVRLSEKAHGPSEPRTLADVAELAAISEPAYAEPLWQRAAASPDAGVAAQSLAVLGGLREEAGDRSGAAKFYRGALAKEEAASGADSARVAVRLNALSRVVEVARGIELLERARGINVKRLGPRHLETGTLTANLAALLVSAGRAQRAARLGQEAVSIFEELLGPDNPRTAIAVAIHGRALRAKGDMAGAEKMYRRALSIDEATLGPKHPQTLADARALAALLRETGKAKQAVELEKRLLNAP
jgi:tetratricopeptide (TPR) repeat protein